MRCLTFILSVATCAVIFLSMAQQAHAQQYNFVTDGTFSNTNSTGLSPGSGNGATTNGGMLGYNVNAVGWSNTTSNSALGYNFLFTTNMVNNTNSVTGNDGPLALYNNKSATNGFTNPPGGGNFIAADGVYQTAAITQTISGLVVGDFYELSFYYGAAQQTTYTTATTENWQVTLSRSAGGTVYTSYTTPTLTNPPAGFTGWDLATVSFTASRTSEVLSFLAGGTPSGQPPFSLLADVSIVAVPEASSVIAASLLLLILCAAPILKSFKQKEGETLGSTEGLESGHS